MWIFKMIMAVFATLFVTFWISFWYQLTNNDYDTLDMIEEKIITLVETDEKYSLNQIIGVLEEFQNTKKLSEKSQTLLEVLIADMYWYLEYEEDYEEALTKQDCYEDEYFDEEDQYCYLIDEMQEDEDIDYEYSHMFNDANHSHLEDQQYEQEDITASYIYDDTWLIFITWEEADLHRQVWDEFTSLFPQRILTHISTVKFFDDPDSDTWAYVERNNQLWTSRTIVFNLDGLEWWNNHELFIHEMGHIITLELSQIAATTPEWASEEIMERHQQKCNTHYVFEWCLTQTSYLYWFIAKFWSEEMVVMTDNEENIYDLYPDEFVTNYAATNPWEDIAETFAYFVTKPKNHGIPWMAWEKIDFLYQYDQLINLRLYIRSKLVH